MIQPIEFFADGEPKGQPRPRAFSRGGHARVFDPGTAEGWKSQIAIAARPHIPTEPLAGPIKLRLWFHIPRPKSHRTIKGVLKAKAPFSCTKKPDIDNYAKAVMDALTVLRFWQDDCQVCELVASKHFDDRSGCSIRITEAAL